MLHICKDVHVHSYLPECVSPKPLPNIQANNKSTIIMQKYKNTYVAMLTLNMKSVI